MNFLRLLFTVYFMALSLMPCMDVAKAQSKTENRSYSFIKSEQNDAHSKTDSCSPFCYCNCCRISVTSIKIKPVIEYRKQIKEYFSKKILFKKNDFAYLVYDQIWQPPKI